MVIVVLYFFELCVSLKSAFAPGILDILFLVDNFRTATRDAGIMDKIMSGDS